MLKRPGMKSQELKSRIESLAPGTQAEITDLTGTEDHYQALVISPAFEGKLMIEQHRLVYGLLKAEVDSGEVHALTLKTYSPAQWSKASQHKN
jgi:acid stress-induced BolA-like protein IbaG/YrbA